MKQRYLAEMTLTDFLHGWVIYFSIKPFPSTTHSQHMKYWNTKDAWWQLLSQRTINASSVKRLLSFWWNHAHLDSLSGLIFLFFLLQKQKKMKSLSIMRLKTEYIVSKCLDPLQQVQQTVVWHIKEKLLTQHSLKQHWNIIRNGKEEHCLIIDLISGKSIY